MGMEMLHDLGLEFNNNLFQVLVDNVFTSDFICQLGNTNKNQQSSPYGIGMFTSKPGITVLYNITDVLYSRPW